MEPVPYDILEAMVQCFGKAFHYKDGVATFFLSQGVSRAWWTNTGTNRSLFGLGECSRN